MPNKIHKILWERDPLDTGCKEKRGMKKEYWGKACGIIYFLDKGENEHGAVKAVFDDFCREDYFSDEQKINVLNKIAESIALERAALSSEKTKLLKEVDSKFLRLIFSNKFIFSSNTKVCFELHDDDLSIGQKKLARKIISSRLYPDRFEDISKTMHDLSDIFVWQDNSEGPLIFASLILFFLEYFKKDVNWFKRVWNDSILEIV